MPNWNIYAKHRKDAGAVWFHETSADCAEDVADVKQQLKDAGYRVQAFRAPATNATIMRKLAELRAEPTIAPAPGAPPAPAKCLNPETSAAGWKVAFCAHCK